MLPPGLKLSDDGMLIYYDDALIHSHYNNKIWTRGQIKALMQRVIDRKLPQPQREKILRHGGDEKAAMDQYFDSLVSALENFLIQQADLHATAVGYERHIASVKHLRERLHGLPLQVPETYLDDDGAERTRMIDNPLREGYETGHVMLDGLPEEIEQPLYDNDGQPAGTELVPNPKYVAASEEVSTLASGTRKIETDLAVMAIVNRRSRRNET